MRIRLPSRPAEVSLEANAERIRAIGIPGAAEPFEIDLARYISRKHCGSLWQELVKFYADGRLEVCWRGTMACSTPGHLRAILTATKAP
jgi:hypothetical protein